MKKHKDYYCQFSQGNFKICAGIIFFLLAITLFYSCSNEENPTSKGGEAKNKSVNESDVKNSTMRNVPDLIEDSAISFSQTVLSNFDNLDYALNKNLYVGFNEQTMQLLSSAQNENDLKTVFEQAGIANSQEIVDILKSIVQAQQNFIAENPNFYSLSQEQQIQYLNTGIEIAKSTYVITQPVIPTDSYFTSACARAFNKSIDRCNGDFGTCAVFAVAGTYAGIVPGLLAAAYCMTTKLTCDGRAKQDYAECIEANDSRVGSNYELRINCNQDSCWTTTPGGAYVERVE